MLSTFKRIFDSAIFVSSDVPQYKVVQVVMNTYAFKQDRSVPERAQQAINEHVAQGWELEQFRPHLAGTLTMQVLLLFKKS